MSCHEVPLHGWTDANLRKSGNIRGDVVCFDHATFGEESFEYAKILIDTTYFPFSEGWVSLLLNGKIFDIHVKEIGWDIINLFRKNGPVFFV